MANKNIGIGPGVPSQPEPGDVSNQPPQQQPTQPSDAPVSPDVPAPPAPPVPPTPPAPPVAPNAPQAPQTPPQQPAEPAEPETPATPASIESPELEAMRNAQTPAERLRAAAEWIRTKPSARQEQQAQLRAYAEQQKQEAAGTPQVEPPAEEAESRIPQEGYDVTPAAGVRPPSGPRIPFASGAERAVRASTPQGSEGAPPVRGGGATSEQVQRESQPAQDAVATGQEEAQTAPTAPGGEINESSGIPSLEEISALSPQEIVKTSEYIIDGLLEKRIDSARAADASIRGMRQIGPHPVLLVMQGFSLGLQGQREQALDALVMAVRSSEIGDSRVELAALIMTKVTPATGAKIEEMLEDVWQAESGEGSGFEHVRAGTEEAADVTPETARPMPAAQDPSEYVRTEGTADTDAVRPVRNIDQIMNPEANDTAGEIPYTPETGFDLDAYIAQREAELGIPDIEAYLNEPPDINWMFPIYEKLKSSEAGVEEYHELTAPQSRIYISAERAQASANLADFISWLDAKEEAAPQQQRWIDDARAILEVLNDIRIPLDPDNLSYAQQIIDGVWMMLEEDALQAKAAKALADEQLREQAEAERKQRAKPRGWERVLEAREAIREFFRHPVIPLSGDLETETQDENGNKATVREHSQPVQDAIARTLSALGYIDSGEYDALEKWLFLAVLLYRGIGIDRDGKLFGQDIEDARLQDVEFIKALDEMISNLKVAGHPFAWSFRDSRLGGAVRYPLPITPGLADFFMKNGKDGGNPNEFTQTDYITFTVNQFNNKVMPNVMRYGDGAQRESLLDMKDVIADRHPAYAKMGDGIVARTPEQVITADEMNSVSSEFAKLANDENDLTELDKDIRLNQERAFKKHLEKEARKGTWWSKTSEAFHGLSTVGIFNGLFLRAKGALAVSGLLENARALTEMSGSTAIFRAMARNRARKRADANGTEYVDPTPSKEFRDEFAKQYAVRAVGEQLKIVGTHGMDALEYAAMSGSEFGKDVSNDLLEQRKNESGLQQGIRWMRSKLRGTQHDVLALSTGSFIGTRRTARIYLDNLCMYLAESDVSFDPDELYRQYLTDPAGFFRTYASRPEGKAALSIAKETSIGNYNLFTNMLRSTIHSNGVTRFLFGFLLTYFDKYAVNIILRFTPMSLSLMWLGKHGFNRVLETSVAAAESRGLMSEERAEDIKSRNKQLDYLTPGGGMSNGLAQCLIIDLVRQASNVAAFSILYAVITSLGVDPPDDDEDDPGKFYRYDEWLVNGEAIEVSWFWNDLLQFAMPAVIAIEAARHVNEQGGDGNAAGWRVFTEGMYLVVEQNPWVRITGLFDVLSQFNATYEIQKERADAGHGEELEKDNLFAIQIKNYLLRRGIATFEPAIIREIMNSTGMYAGVQDLDRSSTMIYTPSTEDDPWETTPTTYGDAMFRRALKYSPMFGYLANVVEGVYAENAGIQRTGYMFHERPLITNSDPFSQAWVNKLNVHAGDGTVVEYDQKKPEIYAEAVDIIMPLIQEYDPQTLKYSGVAFPYNARLAVDHELFNLVDAKRKDFYDRRAAGEWIVPGKFDRDKIIAANIEEQAAYQEMAKYVDEMYALRERLWSDEIPYSAWRMGRKRTTFRPVGVYKEGHPLAGQPAPQWALRFDTENVDITLYPSGTKSSPGLFYNEVIDDGPRSFDFRTALPWQNEEFTDRELVEGVVDNPDLEASLGWLKSYEIERGIGEGQNLLDLITAGGATGINPTRDVIAEIANEYLHPFRAYVPIDEVRKDQKPPEWDLPDYEEDSTPEEPGGGSGGSWGGYKRSSWSSTPRTSYAQNIYSKVFGVRADKASGLFSKSPQYARFDYLRPKVYTKGSREAYRREDF